MLTSWIQDAVPPRPNYAERPGHWVAEPSWPAFEGGRAVHAGAWSFRVPRDFV